MSNDNLTSRSDPITIGEAAPDFTLKDQNKLDWTLGENLRHGPVVLCFFPMAFTGVCESEMKCITSEFDRWQGKGATVVGISCDSFAVLKAWADQLGFKHTLLADMHRHVCKAYGLYWADLNVSRRGTVVVGSDGKIAWIQAREPTDAMNFDEVLASIG